ncbi:MAG: hypothetical protein K2P81_10295 [Bacteriovoracaceae bacterium]|nr:hypothetical protein [Bacteriovoracaceae bacterium]
MDTIHIGNIKFGFDSSSMLIMEKCNLKSFSIHNDELKTLDSDFFNRFLESFCKLCKIHGCSVFPYGLDDFWNFLILKED